jgi:drug/metabolite transporter (DMT)-like permease
MNPKALIAAVTSILVWSTLAVVATFLTHLPLFLLMGIALTLSGLPALFLPEARRVSKRTLAVGVYGIFGFHAFFVFAVNTAPPVEANLIVEIWPLLIVFLTPLFFRDRPLGTHHVIGTLMGFAGAALIVSGGELRLDPAHLPGYGAAAVCAIIWATYSLLTKWLPPFPTAAVAMFCLLSGILSLALHFLLEPRVMPTGGDWPLLIWLAVGPMGGAFFTWDYALKRGDPRIIGALSFFIPLFATAWLVTLGARPLTWAAGAAMLLIITGAFVGSLDLFRRAPRGNGQK